MVYSPHNHKPGRPKRAKSLSLSTTLRLTNEELFAVDRHIAPRLSRTELIRIAMAKMGLFSMASIEVTLYEPPGTAHVLRSPSGPSHVVTVRLDEAERDALWLHSQRTGFPRSTLIRESMHRAGLFGPLTREIYLKARGK